MLNGASVTHSRPTLLTPRDHAALRARPGARASLHDELSNSTRAPLLLR